MPDDGLKHGLSKGRLVSEPPPGSLHGVVAANIVRELGVFVRTQGSGVVLTCDTWFVLERGPDTVRGPDIAYVTRPRYEQLLDPLKPFPGPPDLAVEVLSPSDRHSKVMTKVADFLEGGTTSVWVVNPQTESVDIYSNSTHIQLGSGETIMGGALLPGLRLAVDDLFHI